MFVFLLCCFLLLFVRLCGRSLLNIYIYIQVSSSISVDGFFRGAPGPAWGGEARSEPPLWG
jgi:hypothetical protein